MEEPAMTNRALIVVSTLFGVFALCFGILGVRAITVGPDGPAIDKTALVKRTAAANALERRIRMAASRTPPKLPTVPARIVRPPAAAAPSRGYAAPTAIAVSVHTAPQVKSGSSPGGGTTKSDGESETGNHGDD